MYARTFLGEIYVINYIYTRILVSFLQLCCRKREENSMGKTSKQKKTKADKFIMLPTVDFCFKELMQDKKVRKGLIAALLNVNPTEVESTTLMPTILRKRYPEDKYGILDVRVELKSGVQIDLEMHVLELSKLPPEQQNETDLMKWMRFFGGRCEEDFKKMAEKDEYIGEAYEALKNMSEDEIKRMEYEARQKAIRDYNSYMHSAERRGIKNGIKNGIKIGRAEILKQQVEKKLAKGKSLEIIADECEEEISVIQALINEIRAE